MLFCNAPGDYAAGQHIAFNVTKSRQETAMKHSMKMMWGCVAVIAVIGVLAATGSSAGYLLFVVPCMLMMGAMMWMMMRGGMGGGGDRR